MSVSVRSQLTAGMSVIAAALIAIPPSVGPQPATAAVEAVQVAPRIDLAASVRPLVVEPPSQTKFAAAVAMIERIDPSAPRTALQAVTPAVAPTPLNAASDLIIAGYQFIQYFVDYGVQLTNYVLGFIPYGYLIAAQVNIFYFSLIRPISDSVVYDLVVPVVNDPLNLASYVNGLINVGQTAITAAINTGIAEFNYFFGWLIPPLPPLPLAVAKTVAPVEEQFATPLAASLEQVSETVTEPVVPPTTPVVEKHQVVATATSETTPLPVVETAETVATEIEVEDAVTVPDPESPKTTTATTTTSANGVQAQGEVRNGADGVVKPATKDVATTDDPKASTEPTSGRVADDEKTVEKTKADDGGDKTTADEKD